MEKYYGIFRKFRCGNPMLYGVALTLEEASTEVEYLKCLFPKGNFFVEEWSNSNEQAIG